MTTFVTTLLEVLLGTLLLLVGISAFFAALFTPSPEAPDRGDEYIAWIGAGMAFFGALLIFAAVMK